jgi:hypothetical protein
MYRSLATLFVLAAFAAPASADRSLSADERARLAAAVTEIGCSGGAMEFDDGRYEVDDARCSDGLKYDLKFDAAFKLMKKERDD